MTARRTSWMTGLALAAMLGAATRAVEAQQATPEGATAAPSTRPAPPPAVARGTGPNGATLRCGDGSHPAAGAADAACDGKGGVALRYPLVLTPRAGSARVAPPAAQSRAARPARDTTPPPGFTSWQQHQANVRAENAQATPPAGARLRCGDGSWIVSDTTSARCAGKGGVTLRLAAPVAPSPRPRGN